MPGRYRRPVTPQQQEKAARARETKLAALHDTLTEQVTALATGPQWRAWLQVAAKFHNYSFNNTLLLMAQNPNATQVAGYNLWHDLGRQVDKGEKGLAILAPVTRKTAAEEGAVGAETGGPAPAAPSTVEPESGTRKVVGFRPAYVWDISQTSGDPLPAPTTPVLLAGHAPEGLWDALTAQCEAAGFTVQRREIGGENGPNGYTAYATHQVVVRSDVDDAQAVKTLAHELGHVLMHDPAGFADGQTTQCRGDREVEAESVAYLVAADHGLDTAGYTFAYVASWAAQTGDVDAALRASGTRVLTTAHAVLERTHDHLAGPAALDATIADVVAIDRNLLTVRAAAGAQRTAVLLPPAVEPVGMDRGRLMDAKTAAAAYFTDRYPESWAPDYLARRLGTSDLPEGRVGFAPPGWSNLTDHLRGQGFDDTEIIDAGLGTRASTGRVVDRFRDRLMFPIHGNAHDGRLEVVGFVGRRNPAQDDTTDSRNPKYLNTPQTPLYTKGQHLYGLGDNPGTIERGGLAVVVEGPIDALAVDVASQGMLAGVAPLGTALTGAQAGQLAAMLPAGSDRVVVATDPDPAGERAAARAYELLTAQGLDPRGTSLPAGLDPAATLSMYGPAMLMNRLTGAEPMGRQLVERALGNRELTWAQDKISFAHEAARILSQAPPATWQREVTAVTGRTGLDTATLRTALVDTIATDTDAPERQIGLNRRDDLDRGQHVLATPAQLAAMGGHRGGAVRAVSKHQPGPAQPASALADGRARNGIR